MAALGGAFACLRDYGMRIALDDYGVGNSNLQLWAEMQPDLVKIDRYFFRGIGQDDRKQNMVRAILRSPSTWAPPSWPKASDGRGPGRGARAGHPLRPGLAAGPPRRALLTELTQPLRDSLRVRTPTPLAQRSAGGTAASLKVEAPAALLDKHTNDDVHRLFMEHKHLHAVAVIDADNRPVGIINRRDFSEHYAQRYTRAVRPTPAPPS